MPSPRRAPTTLVTGPSRTRAASLCPRRRRRPSRCGLRRDRLLDGQDAGGRDARDGRTRRPDRPAGGDRGRWLRYTFTFNRPASRQPLKGTICPRSACICSSTTTSFPWRLAMLSAFKMPFHAAGGDVQRQVAKVGRRSGDALPGDRRRADQRAGGGEEDVLNRDRAPLCHVVSFDLGEIETARELRVGRRIVGRQAGGHLGRTEFPPLLAGQRSRQPEPADGPSLTSAARTPVHPAGAGDCVHHRLRGHLRRQGEIDQLLPPGVGRDERDLLRLRPVTDHDRPAFNGRPLWLTCRSMSAAGFSARPSPP